MSNGNQGDKDHGKGNHWGTDDNNGNHYGWDDKPNDDCENDPPPCEPEEPPYCPPPPKDDCDPEPPVVVGPPGPQGEPGPQGPPGEDGTDGTNGTTTVITQTVTIDDVEGVTIKGTKKADIIDTGDSFLFSTTAGNDYVFGLKGKDKLHGGDGNDTLWGGKGKDHLWGDAGDDVLYGGAKADTYHLQGGGDDSVRWTKHDIADFSGIVSDYAALKSMMTQQSNGVFIDLGNGDSILLGKAKLAKLDADHFDF